MGNIRIRTRIILIITFILLASTTFSQDNKKRSIRLPLWTFHEKNVSIYGISMGAFSWVGNDRNTVTNGLRIEVPGIGFLTLLGNGSPISYVDTIIQRPHFPDSVFSEIINGINISSGSWGEIKYNGLTLALFSQNGFIANGIAVAGAWNSINKINGISIGGLLLNEALQHNGIQIGGLGSSSILMSGIQIAALNKAKTMSGLQIGIVNKTLKSTGIQLGFWNVNEKRKLPIFNWNFEKKNK